MSTCTLIHDVDIKRMKKAVWKHYRSQGRHELPWRHTEDPYKILVSEVMLQQTQVSRVLPKYRVFLKRFPTVRHLARAPLADVLTLWSGLGYNSRAKFLHDTAKAVVKEYGGVFPNTTILLRTLKGVGEYTAGAVCVFAHRMSIPLLETNIKTVFIHHLYDGVARVTDRELRAIAERVLEAKRPREWHWALMDYGAYLKGIGVRTNHRLSGYKKQSAFKGSNREVRGALVRAITQGKSVTLVQLEKDTGFEKDRVAMQLLALKEAGMLKNEKGKWSISND